MPSRRLLLSGNAMPTAASLRRRRLAAWPLVEAGSPDTAAVGIRRAGSPYPGTPLRPSQRVKDGLGKKEIPLHA